MDLPALIRNVIADVVVPVAGGLRVSVLLSSVTGTGADGATYDDPVAQLALVEAVGETVASADGTAHLSTSKFTFFEPIVIHEGDKLTVNDVTTKVIKVAGLLDPDGHPYLIEAWTGTP